MNKKNYFILQEDIKYELSQINELVQLIIDKYRIIPDSPNIWEIAGIGKAISDVYTGIERIFFKVVTKIDKDIPEGEDWHIKLIGRVSREIEQIRPAIISKEMGKKLRKYLGFRHLFRNIYGMELEWEEMKKLIEEIEAVFKQTKKEIEGFCYFLLQLP